MNINGQLQDPSILIWREWLCSTEYKKGLVGSRVGVGVVGNVNIPQDMFLIW
jgi:hypothetical protein